MNLKPIAPNMTELRVNGSLRVLFSYSTPVACEWTNGNGVCEFFQTSKKWSRTTSRHINKWLGQYGAKFQDQKYFDELIDHRHTSDECPDLKNHHLH